MCAYPPIRTFGGKPDRVDGRLHRAVHRQARAVCEGAHRVMLELLCVYVVWLNVAQVLRLVSLRSHTCGGYSNKRYAWLKKELLQTYGYEHMLSLPRLESVGLLREKVRLCLLLCCKVECF